MGFFESHTVFSNLSFQTTSHPFVLPLSSFKNVSSRNFLASFIFPQFVYSPHPSLVLLMTETPSSSQAPFPSSSSILCNSVSLYVSNGALHLVSLISPHCCFFVSHLVVFVVPGC